VAGLVSAGSRNPRHSPDAFHTVYSAKRFVNLAEERSRPTSRDGSAANERSSDRWGAVYRIGIPACTTALQLASATFTNLRLRLERARLAGLRYDLCGLVPVLVRAVAPCLVVAQLPLAVRA
jgi:hypothetical protein